MRMEALVMLLIAAVLVVLIIYVVLQLADVLYYGFTGVISKGAG